MGSGCLYPGKGKEASQVQGLPHVCPGGHHPFSTFLCLKHTLLQISVPFFLSCPIAPVCAHSHEAEWRVTGESGCSWHHEGVTAPSSCPVVPPFTLSGTQRALGSLVLMTPDSHHGIVVSPVQSQALPPAQCSGLALAQLGSSQPCHEDLTWSPLLLIPFSPESAA